MTIPAVREGLKARLELITLADGSGIRGFDEYPDVVTANAAAAVVQFNGETFDASLAGQAADINWVVTILTPKTTDRTAKDKLDAYLDYSVTSTTGVRARLNGNLGGAVDFATVTNASGYGNYTLNESDYLGVEFTVTTSVTG